MTSHITNLRRKSSRRKYSSKKTNKWLIACRKHGYMKKGGSFKPIPKKGTTAYNEILKTARSL